MRAMPKNTIPAINRDARHLGMSYGQYVAEKETPRLEVGQPVKLKSLISPEEADRRKAFGEKLVVARESRGLSRRKLARLLGMAPPSIERWEKGQAWPKEENLQKLRAILKKEGGV